MDGPDPESELLCRASLPAGKRALRISLFAFGVETLSVCGDSFYHVFFFGWLVWATGNRGDLAALAN